MPVLDNVQVYQILLSKYIPENSASYHLLSNDDLNQIRKEELLCLNIHAKTF